MTEQKKDSTTRARLANAIAKRVQIRNVRLVQGVLGRVVISDDELPEQIRLALGFKVKHSLEDENKRIVVQVSFFVSGKPSESEEQTEVFNIESTFAVDYQLLGDTPATPDELDEFAKLNGIYNAWPYWREYVQSSVSRMGLPSVVLPVLTPNAVEKMVRDDEEKSANSESTACP